MAPADALEADTKVVGRGKTHNYPILPLVGKMVAYPQKARTVHPMKPNAAPSILSFKLNLDDRHRSTLPAGLLEEAGIDSSSTVLVAYSDKKGRIVLEDPDAALRALREQIAAGMAELGFSGPLEDQLYKNRAEDSRIEVDVE